MAEKVKNHIARWAKAILASKTRAEIFSLIQWWEKEGVVVHGSELAERNVSALKEELKRKKHISSEEMLDKIHLLCQREGYRITSAIMLEKEEP